MCWFITLFLVSTFHLGKLSTDISSSTESNWNINKLFGKKQTDNPIITCPVKTNQTSTSWWCFQLNLRIFWRDWLVHFLCQNWNFIFSRTRPNFFFRQSWNDPVDQIFPSNIINGFEGQFRHVHRKGDVTGQGLSYAFFVKCCFTPQFFYLGKICSSIFDNLMSRLTSKFMSV